jgi:hypothetical protein
MQEWSVLSLIEIVQLVLEKRFLKIFLMQAHVKNGFPHCPPPNMIYLHYLTKLMCKSELS